MKRPSVRYVASLLVACAGLCAASASRASAFSVVQLLRTGGCGGIVPAARPLEPSSSLGRTAVFWSAGLPLRVAVARGGYSGHASGLHVKGSDHSMIALIRQSGCRRIASRQLHDIGIYQRGGEAWVVVGFRDSAVPSQYAAVPSQNAPEPSQGAATAVSPARSFAQPPAITWVETPAHTFVRVPAPAFEPSREPDFAARALQLVNDARARGARCGRRYFPPAPPLRLSGVLTSVASGHAVDMAEHGYFDHVDPRGDSPADRVRAVGYRESLVGENIAYGTESIDETVQGFLDSPEHCENVMDPRFTEMGVADAAGSTSRRGLYWVQLLAEPRGPPAG